jgi:hypothetical protein
MRAPATMANPSKDGDAKLWGLQLARLKCAGQASPATERTLLRGCSHAQRARLGPGFAPPQHTRRILPGSLPPDCSRSRCCRAGGRVHTVADDGTAEQQSGCGAGCGPRVRPVSGSGSRVPERQHPTESAKYCGWSAGLVHSATRVCYRQYVDGALHHVEELRSHCAEHRLDELGWECRRRGSDRRASDRPGDNQRDDAEWHIGVAFDCHDDRVG